MRGRLSLDEVLDRRLEPGLAAPVCVALSGGGDSVALLALTLDWAKARGRRVLALTVDHGLNPESPAWTAFAGDTARRLGADWRALSWAGEKPETGLPAAARAARHGLLADAAREAGATVVLMAHTLDDVAEGEAMRAEGVALGALREWSPSPAWPEGRGVFLLRPLLAAGREALREELRARGLGWIEDPANADQRFHRARVRRGRMSTFAVGNPHPRLRADAQPGPSLSRPGEGFGLLALSPAAHAATLAAALVCASGQSRPPRREPLARLRARIRSGQAFTATLAGARIELSEGEVLIFREPGRSGLSSRRLMPGAASIWDGRFEILVEEACEVRPLAGLANRLSIPDRAEIAHLPPAARPTLPVLVFNRTLSPVLAFRGARVSNLVESRFRAACGAFTHERELVAASRGAARSASLC